MLGYPGPPPSRPPHPHWGTPLGSSPSSQIRGGAGGRLGVKNFLWFAYIFEIPIKF